MQKNLSPVPASISQAALLEALRSGRLYLSPVCASIEETRTEVLTIVSRISSCSSSEDAVDKVWQALLADENRLAGFRLSRGADAGAVNPYRICAIVRYMLSLGLYQGTFRSLCRQLFSEASVEQTDKYRRNFAAYSYADDECLILQSLRHE